MHSLADSLTSDEELACRARLGCAASFERLLRRFQTPVLHFLRRRGFSSDAEDLTQETFLRAFQNLHQYDSRRPFSAWLFTIARNASLNHRRRLRPTANLPTVESSVTTDLPPLDALVKEENRRRLWDRAAEVLPEEQMTALWLHYAEDMPLADIALVLDCSRASVKIMLFRARKKLLPLLGEFAPRRPRAVRLEVSHE